MKKISLILFFSFCLQLTVPVLAVAADAAGAEAGSSKMSAGGKKAAIVAKAAAFGLGGGLVVGLASQVVKRKTKNIFLAGSLGMYTGIAMGLYIVTAPKGTTPYEGPDTYEDYGNYQGLTLPEKELVKIASAKSESAELSVLSLSF